MDEAESKVKRRVLPSWMTDDNAGPRKSCTTRTRRTEKKKKKTSRAVYCMNEEELVECALEILSQGRMRRDNVEKTKAEPEDDKQQPSSDTDSDGPLISPGSKKPRTIPPSPEDSQDPRKDSDDDALKYVREIFFS